MLARLHIAADLLRFFWSRKSWWLTPMIVLLLLFAIFIVVAQTSALAPFIYSLF